jgi:hypothetical protein
LCRDDQSHASTDDMPYGAGSCEWNAIILIPVLEYNLSGTNMRVSQKTGLYSM